MCQILSSMNLLDITEGKHISIVHTYEQDPNLKTRTKWKLIHQEIWPLALAFCVWWRFRFINVSLLTYWLEYICDTSGRHTDAGLAGVAGGWCFCLVALAAFPLVTAAAAAWAGVIASRLRSRVAAARGRPEASTMNGAWRPAAAACCVNCSIVAQSAPTERPFIYTHNVSTTQSLIADTSTAPVVKWH